MNTDYITYAKYKALYTKDNKIYDLMVVAANKRFNEMVDMDPIGKLRSFLLPINDEMCATARNVLDIGIPKHFSYMGTKELGKMECMVEKDMEEDCVNVYTVDMDMLSCSTEVQSLRNNISTLLSMYNVSVMHLNLDEHYMYNDNILTTNFSASNPDLYVGKNIHSTYELYNSLNEEQRVKMMEEIERLKNGEIDFLPIDCTITNSCGETVNVKGYMMPERNKHMYILSVHF